MIYLLSYLLVSLVVFVVLKALFDFGESRGIIPEDFNPMEHSIRMSILWFLLPYALYLYYTGGIDA